MIHELHSSNKTSRHHWFSVGGNWRAKCNPKNLPRSECVYNEIQGQMTWSIIELSKGLRHNIKLALSVSDESREWALLTNELAFNQGGLTNVPPKSGIDYSLNFKEGKGASVS